MRLLDTEEIERQVLDLKGWQVTDDRTGLFRAYQFGSFPAAIKAIDKVASEAEAMNHHPDMDVRWRTVTFGLSTHAAGGLTQMDIELAHRIQDIANQLSAV